MEGRVAPAGRRGGRGTQMWEVDALERFLRGDARVILKPERSGAPRLRGEDEQVRERLELIQSGAYSPYTLNTDLSVLKVILKHAKIELGLLSSAAADVPAFDTSQHRCYSREEPNALTADELREFLACMREKFPQFFAMTFTGFATGLRPSSLRPLRRTGATPDVLWDKGKLLVRRSHTRGDVEMIGTKTGGDVEISVPPELMDVLRWHVETQLRPGPQKESELLFPSEVGGYRSPSALDKPFAAVAKAIEPKQHTTPRAMRRSFQDL